MPAKGDRRSERESRKGDGEAFFHALLEGHDRALPKLIKRNRKLLDVPSVRELMQSAHDSKSAIGPSMAILNFNATTKSNVWLSCPQLGKCFAVSGGSWECKKKATTAPRDSHFFQGDGARQPSWPLDCSLSF